MQVLYRGLEPAETGLVIELWAQTLDAPREQIVHDFYSDPDHVAHTRVAAAPDGRLLAAVHYCHRRIRDAGGLPQLVGGVVGVASLPEARGQGHARRLMELTVEAMRADGCRWSLLFTDVNGFYERLGWRTYATRYREGRLAPPAPADSRYSVRALAPGELDGALADLEAIYGAFNAARPLTTLRDRHYWQQVIGPRLRQPSVQIYTAAPAADGLPCGYAVVHFHPSSLVVTELGALPGHEPAIPALLAAARVAARARGVEVGRVYLPHEPPIDAAVAGHFSGVSEGRFQVLMGRPLAAGCDDAEIATIFGAPSAIAWPADDF